MKSKEELILMWVIVGLATMVFMITYPPIIFLVIFGYASVSLWKHYN